MRLSGLFGLLFTRKEIRPNQEQFLAVWQILYALYTDLREALATEGKGYEGMIFREVVEQMEKDECCDLPYTKVVFVGLNALSVAEERFLSGLQKRGIAEFLLGLRLSESDGPR